MKKLLFTFVLLLLPMIASADAVEINGIYYYLSATAPYTAEVTCKPSGYYSGSITIPASVTEGGKTYNVTSIGRYAFQNCSDLNSIDIPNSVTSIYAKAFENCTSLTTINFPSSVVTMGYNAFENTGWYNAQANGLLYLGNSLIGYKGDKPTGAITIIAGTKTVLGLSDCNELTSVTIPNSVTNIGEYAFYGCTGLTTINLSSITTICANAFSGCGLTSITIPSSVTSIDGSAFNSCHSLTSMSVESGNATYDSRDGCNAIIEKATNTLISACQASTIPNTVTNIGEYAFFGCGLYSFTIPSITIPSSVTNIGEYAFDCCYINKVYYESIESLCNINFANQYSNPIFYSDGAHLYIGGVEVTEVVIPSGITSINNSTFAHCRYRTSVTIPSSVTSIGGGAFYNCSGLTSVTIPNSVTSIGNDAFYGCIGLTSIIIPNSVTSIGAQAFQSCENLTSFAFSNNMTSIDFGVLMACFSLTSVYIPKGITTINAYAFANSGLTAVTIPSSVTNIRGAAFADCNDLTAIRVQSATPITLTEGPFSNSVYQNATLYVPSGSSSDYASADFWQNFNSISEVSSVSITLGSSGKSTYCSEEPLNFTDVSGIYAYIVSGFNPSTANFIVTRVYEVPAGTGLYIAGTPGNTYNIPIESTDFIYSNMMKGVLVPTVIPANEDGYANYVLSNDGHGGVIFKHANNASSPANKAYVQVPSSTAGAREFYGIETDDGSTTGLDGIFTSDTKEAEGDYYNLSGQKVKTPQKGLYIKNGKKIIIH